MEKLFLITYFDGSKQHYQKFRKVKWIKKGSWKIAFNLAFKNSD